MKWAFVGVGNLASAILRGGNDFFKQHPPLLYNPTRAKAEALAQEVGGVAIELAELQKADVVVFGFKPQHFPSAFPSMKQYVKKDALVISLLAATNLEKLQKDFPKAGRIMTNTPCAVKKGIAVFYAPYWTGQERKEIENVFAKFSLIINASEEAKLDYLTLMLASTPALIFETMKIFTEHLVSSGFQEGESVQMMKTLFTGVNELAQNSKHSFSELITQVASKGGITEAALKSLSEQDLKGTYSEAITQGLKRLEQMKQA